MGGERESYVLLTKDTVYLFTNGLYKEVALKLSNPTNKPIKLPINFVEISREKPIGKELARLTRTVLVKKLGFEENDLTVAEYNKLKQQLKGITLVPTTNRIEELRMIKREDEIENIRAAAKLTDQCFTFILSKLTPTSAKASAGKAGVTESEIAWEIEAFFHKRGATLAFSPIVAFGKNSSQPHYIAPKGGSTPARSNDIVLLDFGARVNGYCSDMTRVVFIGKPKDEWKRAYETVLAAQQAVLEYLTGSRPVNKYRAQGRALSSQLSGSSADRIAREVIRKAGFPPYPHSLGHAVGLDVHEAPRLKAWKDRILPKWKDAILLPGMVVTVEPGVYIEEQYGIRIEDLILLKQDNIEVLSKSPTDIIVL